MDVHSRTSTYEVIQIAKGRLMACRVRIVKRQKIAAGNLAKESYKGIRPKEFWPPNAYYRISKHNAVIPAGALVGTIAI